MDTKRTTIIQVIEENTSTKLFIKNKTKKDQSNIQILVVSMSFKDPFQKFFTFPCVEAAYDFVIGFCMNIIENLYDERVQCSE